MNKNDKNEAHMILKKIMWDYDIDPGEIYDFISGERDNLYHFTNSSKVDNADPCYYIAFLFSI
jgi:hypothetical protein